MLQETNLEKALKQMMQGKTVLAATKKNSNRYTFRSLKEILDNFVFLINVPAVEDPEFKETVEKMTQNIQEETNKSEAVENGRTGYSGFLHIRCRCGEEKSFCTRPKINSYECEKCGEKIELNNLKLAFVNCECGKNWRYFTNETAKMFDLNCIECGQPVAMKYNEKKKLYETIKD